MNIFCYGSLMWIDLWNHEVHNEYANKEALVKGFRSRRIKGRFEPALVRIHGDNHDDETVTGRLYMDVNNEDFERVSSYHGKEYEVIDGVCFTPENDIAMACKIFMWKPEYRTLLAAEDWNMDWFEEKALHDYRKKVNQSLF